MNGPVGQTFQLFHDLFQPDAALGVVLLCWQSAPRLRIFVVQSANINDFRFQHLNSTEDGFSPVGKHITSIR